MLKSVAVHGKLYLTMKTGLNTRFQTYYFGLTFGNVVWSQGVQQQQLERATGAERTGCQTCLV